MSKVNVRFNHTCEIHPPLMREYKGAKITRKKGVQWLNWYWTPESTQGAYDCGFSGISENHKNFAELKAKLIQ